MTDQILFEHPDFTIYGGHDPDCPYDEEETDPKKRGWWDVYLIHRDGTRVRFDGCNNCGSITATEEKQ